MKVPYNNLHNIEPKEAIMLIIIALISGLVNFFKRVFTGDITIWKKIGYLCIDIIHK